jgi:hypothetical protein
MSDKSYKKYEFLLLSNESDQIHTPSIHLLYMVYTYNNEPSSECSIIFVLPSQLNNFNVEGLLTWYTYNMFSARSLTRCLVTSLLRSNVCHLPEPFSTWQFSHASQSSSSP